MRTIAKVVAVVLILVVLVFFLPVFPQSTTKNYIVSSGLATVYNSFGLQMINCGGYYYTKQAHLRQGDRSGHRYVHQK